MNYITNNNKTRRLMSLIRKAYDGRDLEFVFAFSLNTKGYCMSPEYKLSLNIDNSLRIIDIGNQVLIGFQIPEIWHLGDINCEQDLSEEDQIWKWFRDGMILLRHNDPQLYNNLQSVNGSFDRNNVEGSDWYQESIVGEINKIKNECELRYRVKRVTGGLFTNPDNISPLIQIDFDKDQVYIIDRGKFKLIDKKLSDLTFTDIKKIARVKYSAFEGKFTGYYDSVQKCSVRM